MNKIVFLVCAVCHKKTKHSISIPQWNETLKGLEGLENLLNFCNFCLYCNSYNSLSLPQSKLKVDAGMKEGESSPLSGLTIPLH